MSCVLVVRYHSDLRRVRQKAPIGPCMIVCIYGSCAADCNQEPVQVVMWRKLFRDKTGLLMSGIPADPLVVLDVSCVDDNHPILRPMTWLPVTKTIGRGKVSTRDFAACNETLPELVGL